MEKEIIIFQPWGGLGDNLQFSTLPELYHLQGYKVYIANDNAVRNPEIYDLVWGKNPYVSGKKPGDSNAGSCNGQYWPPEYCNEWFMHRIEIAHGFPRSNYYPKIYYVPKINPELSNTYIVDITCVTATYSVEKYYEFFEKIQHVIQENYSKIKIISFAYMSIDSHIDDVYKKYFGNCETLKINDIYEYCDVLKSCNTFITVWSGAHSLASAVKQDNSYPKIICYFPHSDFSPEHMKGIYNYRNVDYII